MFSDPLPYMVWRAEAIRAMSRVLTVTSNHETKQNVNE